MILAVALSKGARMKYRAVCKYLELCNLNFGLAPPYCTPRTCAWPVTLQPDVCTHKGCSRTRKCSGCNYVSIEYRVPNESMQTVPSKQGGNNAPRTEAYSSGLCLFIWKCYSLLSSAVKKAFSLPGAHEDFCVFHSAALLPVCLGNSAPIWLVGCAAGHTSFRLRTLVAVELW